MLKNIGGVVTFLTLVLTLNLLYAWVGTILWDWFIFRLWGIPVPSLAQLYGLMLTVRFLVIGSDTRDQTIRTWREAFSLLLNPTLNTLLTLLIGWAIEGWLL